MFYVCVDYGQSQGIELLYIPKKIFENYQECCLKRLSKILEIFTIHLQKLHGITCSFIKST